MTATSTTKTTTLGASGSAAMSQGSAWLVDKDTVNPASSLEAVLKNLGDGGSAIDTFQGGVTTNPVDAATRFAVVDGGTTMRHCGEFRGCARKIIAGEVGAKVGCKTAVPGASVSCS